MQYVLILALCAATFGICFLLDKGFSKLFRGKKEHRSGLSVRLSKRYGSFGIILAVLGIAAVFAGISGGSWALVAGGCVLILLGAGLITYYMTFGVFYDEDGFLLTTFGRRTVSYRYADICAQQLYNASGSVVIELHMAGGRAVQLQSGMSGVYPFLDTAFAGWLRQKGISAEDCPFHDPANSCWFPPKEG